MASAALIVGLTIAARTAPWAGFDTYPELASGGAHGAVEAWSLLFAYALAALLPFADRRGIAP
jgi:energy-coupling factor transport system permease protein